MTGSCPLCGKTHEISREVYRAESRLAALRNREMPTSYYHYHQANGKWCASNAVLIQESHQ